MPTDRRAGTEQVRYRTVDGTVWPVSVGNIEWKLRYAPQALTRGDQLVAASVLAAYTHLTDSTVRMADAEAALGRARQAVRDA